MSVIGGPELDRLRRIADALNAASQPAGPALRGAGLLLQRAIVLELSKPGHGRLYPRGGGKVHRASAPTGGWDGFGEPPAVDTGELRASIGMEAVGDVLRVGSGLAKAGGLEFGMTTPTGGIVGPRPFMRPALAAVRAQMGETVAAELRNAGRRPL